MDFQTMIKLDNSLNDYLEYLSEIGCVIKYYIFDWNGNNSPSEAIHRLSIVKSFIEISNEENEHRHKFLERGYEYIGDVNYSQNYSDMTATKISYNELLNDPNDGNSEYYTKGYRSAFLKPPHDLLLHKKINQSEFFIDATNKIIGMEYEIELILKWNTDWTDYFDDGKECWGAHLWTIYNKEKSRLIVATAVAID